MLPTVTGQWTFFSPGLPHTDGDDVWCCELLYCRLDEFRLLEVGGVGVRPRLRRGERRSIPNGTQVAPWRADAGGRRATTSSSCLRVRVPRCGPAPRR